MLKKILVLGFVLVSLCALGASPLPEGSKRSEVILDVKFYEEEGWLRVKVLDPDFQLNTDYGKLIIPWSDVQKIDFASRTSPETKLEIATAVSNLGSSDFNVREEMTDKLKAFKSRAYQNCLNATKNSDPEIAKRATELVSYFKSTIPSKNLVGCDYDTVYTINDQKLIGKIEKTNVLIKTVQFGEQNLQFYDVSNFEAKKKKVVEVAPAPKTMIDYKSQIGKEMNFLVIGKVDNLQTIWGDKVYSLDSDFAGSAVHAGAVKPNETAVIRVRIVESPPQFIGSIANGISTSPYGSPFVGGAYEFILFPK